MIFSMSGYFGPGSDKFESWKIFGTFDEVFDVIVTFLKL